ncbi:MAG: hypothetical protein Q8S03_07640 [Brevundimonas sp.]|uniref:hypothetical protein n=1 Tax=Brevundimonas sp. TaxID=1871086 RepID=UPI0027369026|nr:hypothetical protein [Brevundimonas sp.]MDP3404545.1 hypothetical protein [Brevundimonas sp.]
MIRTIALSLTTLGLAACTFPQPWEADPASPVQWERRQESIERREAERQRLCAIIKTDTDRYRRDCRRPGDPIR